MAISIKDAIPKPPKLKIWFRARQKPFNADTERSLSQRRKIKSANCQTVTATWLILHPWLHSPDTVHFPWYTWEESFLAQANISLASSKKSISFFRTCYIPSTYKYSGCQGCRGTTCIWTSRSTLEEIWQPAVTWGWGTTLQQQEGYIHSGSISGSLFSNKAGNRRQEVQYSGGEVSCWPHRRPIPLVWVSKKAVQPTEA